MTAKELFYSLIDYRERIKFIFSQNTANFIEYFQSCIDDSVSDNGGDDEVYMEPSNNGKWMTQEIYDIAVSLEKQVFAANKELASHSYNKTIRQDDSFRFTMGEVDIEPHDIFMSSFQRSRWAHAYFDYNNGAWKTLYIAYQFCFYLNDDFTLREAQIVFIDLNELTFQVYPENKINVEEIKNSATAEEIWDYSTKNKERWSDKERESD